MICPAASKMMRGILRSALVLVLAALCAYCAFLLFGLGRFRPQLDWFEYWLYSHIPVWGAPIVTFVVLIFFVLLSSLIPYQVVAYFLLLASLLWMSAFLISRILGARPPAGPLPSSARGGGFSTMIPGAISAFVVACVYFLGFLLPDAVTGPTGRTLAAFFGLLAAPIVIAMGFGAGWSAALLTGIILHRIRGRRAANALLVFVPCTFFVFAMAHNSILCFWSSSPSATSRQIRWAYDNAVRTNNDYPLRDVARNPAASRDIIDRLMQREDMHRWLARNPALPPNILRALSKEPREEVLYGLIRNPATPIDVLRALTKHESLGPSAVEALQARTPKDKK